MFNLKSDIQLVLQVILQINFQKKKTDVNPSSRIFFKNKISALNLCLNQFHNGPF